MTVRDGNKFVNVTGKPIMNLLCSFVALLILTNCGSNVLEAIVNDRNASDVTNEAIIVISDKELRELKERALNGELKSAKILANYFSVNLGDDDLEAVRWQLQAARLGDCEYWADLMFLQEEDKFIIPDNYFAMGETLISIGEARKCPKYTVRKIKP